MAETYQQVEKERSILRARVERLEVALREIRDYNAYVHPDEYLVTKRDAALKESSECTACQYAKKVKWPPSGLCDEHYGVVTSLEDKVSEMYDYKQKWEPVEIARKALEVVE